VKTWLNGTFHGVSAKHLPRYAREWNYRFNRRRRIADLTDFPAPPSRHPANHHLPPACTRRSNQRSPTCSNRIGKLICARIIEVRDGRQIDLGIDYYFEQLLARNDQILILGRPRLT